MRATRAYWHCYEERGRVAYGYGVTAGQARRRAVEAWDARYSRVARRFQ